MKPATVTFRITRYKPGHIDPPRQQDFPVQCHPYMTVLDGLEQIRLHRDATLMYRHCCHHASCGTCACTINDTPALACATRIADLNTDTIHLAPLANHTCVGDLAVDMTDFFREINPQWATLRACENTPAAVTPQGIDGFKRLQDCIECGCCVASCPVTSSSKAFMGPAVLAATNTEIHNRPQRRKLLLQIAADPRGAAMCQRHLTCSRVCPAQVYPARHIADLQRAIGIQTKKPKKP